MTYIGDDTDSGIICWQDTPPVRARVRARRLFSGRVERPMYVAARRRAMHHEGADSANSSRGRLTLDGPDETKLIDARNRLRATLSPASFPDPDVFGRG